MQIKVLHLTNSLDCGGLERVIVSLVREGHKLGQQIGVVCIDHPGTLSPQIEELGVKVWSLDKPPGVKWITAKRLAACFREFDPDVVHAHEIGSLFYACIASIIAGKPQLVHTEHGRNFGHKSRLRVRMMAKFASLFAKRFFCVSDDIAEHVTSRRIVGKSKTVVVRNGIDTLRYQNSAHRRAIRDALGVTDRTLVIGTVGRLVEVKRQDILIRGFAKFHNEIPDARLVLVGDGPQKDSLKELATNIGIESLVLFTGYQQNPEQYLSAMDIFALTSSSEGMPLTVLEAWASGVPVVTSRVGGLPELIREGETGLMFKSEDADELAMCLTRISNNCDLADKMRMTAMSYVREHYDVSAMARTYDSNYRDILQISQRDTRAALT